jgi:signal transduction histidine kinase
VAHELRTPLTLLRLQIEDAAGRIEPTLAESLQEELRRLSDYVDQSLLLATAEQGRLTLKLEKVTLVPVLMEMLEDYQRLARTESRLIELITCDEVTIVTDSRYLRQIFHTLLTNALRHGIGPIKIGVSRSADGATCRFENACAPSIHAQPGHGLGLRLARAITSALGARFSGTTSANVFVAELYWPNRS